MALVKCHECGNKVSTTAKACPKCGAEVKVPVQQPSMNVNVPWKVAVPVIFGVFVLLIVGGLQHQEEPLTPEQAKAAAQKAKRRAQEDKRFAAMEATKTALKEAARDPDSIRYDDWAATLDGSLVCVRVNGKNAFGGYSGWKEYAYIGGQLSGRLDDLDKTCFNKKLALYPVTDTGRLIGDATK